MPSMRLQKVLAEAGVASRRKSEEIIQAGRVRVNGKVVKEMGTKVDPNHPILEGVTSVTPYFMFSVYLIDILIRIFIDSFTCLLL